MFMFKNLKTFNISVNVEHLINPSVLQARLDKHLYVDLKQQSLCAGWIKPVDFASNELLHAHQGHYLMKWRKGRKVVPGNVWKDATVDEIKSFTEREGYTPGKRMVKEIKEMTFEPEITYDRYGRMQYHPDYHPNHGKPMRISEQKYLIENYETMGPEHCSFALGRTIHSLMQYAFLLRKQGLMAKRSSTKRLKRLARSTNRKYEI